MKDMKLKLALFALATVLVTPHTTLAASAVAATDNTGLFVVTFDFLAGKEAYRIPIGATHNLPYGSNSNFIGYDIVTEEGTSASLTKTAGLVLSKQKVVDNLYYEIKPGERARFTFVGIATVPETAPTAEYRAVLTNVPHFSGTERRLVLEDRLGSFKSDTAVMNKDITGQAISLTPIK